MRGIVRDAYSEVRLGVGIGRDHFGAFLEVVNDDDVLIRTHAGQNKKSNQSSMNCFNFLPDAEQIRSPKISTFTRLFIYKSTLLIEFWIFQQNTSHEILFERRIYRIRNPFLDSLPHPNEWQPVKRRKTRAPFRALVPRVLRAISERGIWK